MGATPSGFTELLISYEQVFKPSRVGKPSPSLTVSERAGPGEHPRPSQRSAAGDCWDCFFKEGHGGDAASEVPKLCSLGQIIYTPGIHNSLQDHKRWQLCLEIAILTKGMPGCTCELLLI